MSAAFTDSSAAAVSISLSFAAVSSSSSSAAFSSVPAASTEFCRSLVYSVVSSICSDLTELNTFYSTLKPAKRNQLSAIATTPQRLLQTLCAAFPTPANSNYDEDNSFSSSDVSASTPVSFENNEIREKELGFIGVREWQAANGKKVRLLQLKVHQQFVGGSCGYYALHNAFLLFLLSHLRDDCSSGVDRNRNCLTLLRKHGLSAAAFWYEFFRTYRALRCHGAMLNASRRSSPAYIWRDDYLTHVAGTHILERAHMEWLMSAHPFYNDIGGDNKTLTQQFADHFTVLSELTSDRLNGLNTVFQRFASANSNSSAGPNYAHLFLTGCLNHWNCFLVQQLDSTIEVVIADSRNDFLVDIDLELLKLVSLTHPQLKFAWQRNTFVSSREVTKRNISLLRDCSIGRLSAHAFHQAAFAHQVITSFLKTAFIKVPPEEDCKKEEKQKMNEEDKKMEIENTIQITPALGAQDVATTQPLSCPSDSVHCSSECVSMSNSFGIQFAPLDLFPYIDHFYSTCDGSASEDLDVCRLWRDTWIGWLAGKQMINHSGVMHWLKDIFPPPVLRMTALERLAEPKDAKLQPIFWRTALLKWSEVLLAMLERALTIVDYVHESTPAGSGATLSSYSAVFHGAPPLSKQFDQFSLALLLPAANVKSCVEKAKSVKKDEQELCFEAANAISSAECDKLKQLAAVLLLIRSALTPHRPSSAGRKRSSDSRIGGR